MPIQIGRRPDHDFDQPLGLLSDCHRRIEHFLDLLVAIAQRVASGPLTPDQRRDLESALRYFSTAAHRHTADEEQSLFPRLRARDDPTTTETIEVLGRLERDHHDADGHHSAVDTLGRRWMTTGRLDPAEAHALGTHLAALEAIYKEHIGIEDRKLFPAAARLLSSDQLIAVGLEMAARRRAGTRP
jgi:hemerythrin-like domain-containing protein